MNKFSKSAFHSLKATNKQEKDFFSSFLFVLIKRKKTKITSRRGTNNRQKEAHRRAQIKKETLVERAPRTLVYLQPLVVRRNEEMNTTVGSLQTSFLGNAFL